MVYEIFIEKCPTEQARKEGIMSVVTPDPKAVTLLAMKSGKLYTRSLLFKEILDY